MRGSWWIPAGPKGAYDIPNGKFTKLSAAACWEKCFNHPQCVAANAYINPGYDTGLGFWWPAGPRNGNCELKNVPLNYGSPYAASYTYQYILYPTSADGMGK